MVSASTDGVESGSAHEQLIRVPGSAVHGSSQPLEALVLKVVGGAF